MLMFQVSLKELNLALSPNANPTPNPTLIPHTHYFGYDSRKSNYFVMSKFVAVIPG